MSISDAEFAQIQQWIFQQAGITLGADKKLLVSSRLSRRVRELKLARFTDYYQLLVREPTGSERQKAIDLLTTNETSFFREAAHFRFLVEQILPRRQPNRPFRVWSAACSSGEEPYSVAMVLADALGERGAWEVLGSDLSERVLETAKAGRYAIERTSNIPPQFLTRFCLRGVRAEQGRFMISAKLRQHVTFMQLNLNEPLPQVGKLDVIFLRNVLIYFNKDVRMQVVERLVETLHPEGFFIIGHSDSLARTPSMLSLLSPSIFQKHSDTARRG